MGIWRVGFREKCRILDRRAGDTRSAIRVDEGVR